MKVVDILSLAIPIVNPIALGTCFHYQGVVLASYFENCSVKEVFSRRNVELKRHLIETWMLAFLMEILVICSNFVLDAPLLTLDRYLICATSMLIMLAPVPFVLLAKRLPGHDTRPVYDSMDIYVTGASFIGAMGGLFLYAIRSVLMT